MTNPTIEKTVQAFKDGVLKIDNPMDLPFSTSQQFMIAMACGIEDRIDSNWRRSLPGYWNRLDHEQRQFVVDHNEAYKGFDPSKTMPETGLG